MFLRRRRTLPKGPLPERYARMHVPSRRDHRTEGEHDRDRVLYSSAFRRLVGVTQVASAIDGHVFHNRLTHTLEVAQIAHRTAQRLVKEQPDVAKDLGGVDPDVAEAAALAHDLGHPPFGHVGEEKLQELVEGYEKSAGLKERERDSFEGNAQSFRIVTNLAFRHEASPGLDLTRATLAAILKYPWFRNTADPERKKKKWGAYRSEEKEFNWARELFPAGDEEKSAEAEIMDWSDDVAYAVHDVEDFYRAGLIPLDRLIRDPDEVDRFLAGTFNRWERQQQKPLYPQPILDDALRRVLALTKLSRSFWEPYCGSSKQRAALRTLTATLIGRYITNGIKLQIPSNSDPKRVQLDVEMHQEITILKELNWYYVIETPSLLTQQIGQRHVIDELYQEFMAAAMSGKVQMFPTNFREKILQLGSPSSYKRPEKVMLARIIADLIVGMTEAQALEMHQRLTGQGIGSILDVVLRA